MKQDPPNQIAGTKTGEKLGKEREISLVGVFSKQR